MKPPPPQSSSLVDSRTAPPPPPPLSLPKTPTDEQPILHSSFEPKSNPYFSTYRDIITQTTHQQSVYIQPQPSSTPEQQQASLQQHYDEAQYRALCRENVIS